MVTTLVRGGLVVDGSRARGRRLDVLIEGGRIAQVGSPPDTPADTLIDARDCVVAPGFVDMHSHSDFTLPINPTADSLVHQGITTVIVGQCGISPAPSRDSTQRQALASLKGLLEIDGLPLPWDEWSSFGDNLSFLSTLGTSVNVASLVGQGTVRRAVVGLAGGEADEAQMTRMVAEVASAMDEGAIGLSTGLIYPPGSYASTDELIKLARVAGEWKGLYFTHVRGEGDSLLSSITEAIHIGREANTPVEISHFKATGLDNWPKLAEAIELIDAARSEGLDITADLYPYLAGSTGLAALLPEWAQEGGEGATLDRLADRDTRRAITDSMGAGGFFRYVEWDRVLVSRCRVRPEYEGRYIADLAHDAGQSPYDWLFDALREAELDVGMIVFSMSEENVKLALRAPWTMIGTDGLGLATEGPLARGVPHPRSYGTFPRILGRYVRELGVLTMEDAIWKMSGLPARKLGWKARGLIRQGYAADLVVFDPHVVADRGTYEAPHQYPAGIRYVFVNGRLTIRDGVHTGARSGEVLRPQ